MAIRLGNVKCAILFSFYKFNYIDIDVLTSIIDVFKCHGYRMLLPWLPYDIAMVTLRYRHGYL